ncbi:hypothetical protein [Natronorubrum daqingense]|uniref:Uncharacterized protein n=1 Tax=Natronorubrum daqingense TaxID=588898 RepID=A0A1N7CNV6_9EURY|nr:hypothetical protein [Natronorubrum daqingense]APX96987.1 hypothetical protein BB347_10345 [Natronorubrum daqingense]SIR65240.1 hypothetical protein SAMN05421809_1799 [Natronorubrum daqingense]
MLTPPERARDASLSRRSLLAASAAAISLTAGCTGFLERDAESSLVDAVPGETTLLAHLDVGAVADGEASEADLEAALEGLDAFGSERATEAIVAFEDRTGLDPLEANEAVLFGDVDAISSDVSEEELASAATEETIIVDGDWSEDDVVASLEETTDLEYEAESAGGDAERYEPASGASGNGGDGDGDDGGDGDGDEPPVLGVLGDGRYVVGDEDGVDAALETHAGDEEAVSGSIRSAYEGANDGPVTVAAVPDGSPLPDEFAFLAGGNDDIFEEIDAVGLQYDTIDDETVDLELDFHVGDDGDAEQLETVLQGGLSALGELDDELSDASDEATLERDETVVSIAYQGDADAVAALLAVLEGV